MPRFSQQIEWTASGWSIQDQTQNVGNAELALATFETNSRWNSSAEKLHHNSTSFALKTLYLGIQYLEL
jgi:hypothetical protein